MKNVKATIWKVIRNDIRIASRNATDSVTWNIIHNTTWNANLNDTESATFFAIDKVLGLNK